MLDDTIHVSEQHMFQIPSIVYVTPFLGEKVKFANVDPVFSYVSRLTFAGEIQVRFYVRNYHITFILPVFVKVRFQVRFQVRFLSRTCSL